MQDAIKFKLFDSFQASYIELVGDIDLQLLSERAKKETKTLKLSKVSVSDGTDLDFSDFGKLESLQIEVSDIIKALSLLKINHLVLKNIKFYDYTFDLAQHLEKAIEFGHECLEFLDCELLEESFQTLVGMNEGLVTGHEYTFEIKNTLVTLVKSQNKYPGDEKDEDGIRSKYVLTYA